MLRFAVMQGRKAQKNASTPRITDSGEFDEHALIGDLRILVEESELSRGKFLPGNMLILIESTNLVSLGRESRTAENLFQCWAKRSKEEKRNACWWKSLF
jgi:hypothetical protein